MLEGSWALDIQDDQLSVRAKGAEISHCRGMVTFTPGEAMGESCSKPVPVTELGSVGEEIVTTLRRVPGWQKIGISEHMLSFRFDSAHKTEALQAVCCLMSLHVGVLDNGIGSKQMVQDIKAGKFQAPPVRTEYPSLVTAA